MLFMTVPSKPLRAFTLLLALASGVLLFVGCGPAQPPPSLQYSEGFTCEGSLTDKPCILCFKQKCCAEARVCTFKKGQCPCSLQCLASGISPGCAAACTDVDDRAMALCAATSCAPVCPPKGTSI